jgi:hypothetical protein
VVIYTGASPSLPDSSINGSAAGPASGHVALGRIGLTTSGLYRACLTTSDRSKGGWNVGMVCADVASAIVTITP